MLSSLISSSNSYDIVNKISDNGTFTFRKTTGGGEILMAN